MSWDISLERPDGPGYVPLCEETERPFDLQEVRQVLLALCPGAEEVSPGWINCETADYFISFTLGEADIFLTVHILRDGGGAKIMELLRTLCRRLDCRAFDCGTAEYLI